MAHTPSVRSRTATVISISLVCLLIIGLFLLFVTPAAGETLKQGVKMYREMFCLVQILLSSYPAREINVSIVATNEDAAAIVSVIHPLWEESALHGQDAIAREIAGVTQKRAPQNIVFDEIRVLFISAQGTTTPYCFEAVELDSIDCD